MTAGVKPGSNWRKMIMLEEAIKLALSKSNLTILYMAPTMDRARISLRYVKELGFGKVNITYAEIKFENGSRIYFANSNNPDKLRGLRLNAAFIEERVIRDVQEIINLALIP